MANDYHMDLEAFSLAEYRRALETGRLIPSEVILRDGLAERFARLESMGIRSLAGLTAALRTKKKLERFAEQSGIPKDYLTVLRRRAGSYAPRPIALNKLIGIDPGVVERLAEVGVKDTRQLFERAKTVEGRAALAIQADVPEGVMLELTKLSDLARPPYVGPIFARLLYESGIDTIEKLSAMDAQELYDRLVETKVKTGVYRAPIPGVEDMATWLQPVGRLPRVVEY
jgi:hypothetical protein